MLNILLLLLFVSFDGINCDDSENKTIGTDNMTVVSDIVHTNSKVKSIEMDSDNKTDAFKMNPDSVDISDFNHKNESMKIKDKSKSDSKIKGIILRSKQEINEIKAASKETKLENNNKMNPVKVIPKCCPIGELRIGFTCVKYTNLNNSFKNLDFSDVTVYSKDLYDTGMKVKDEFSFEAGIILNSSFSDLVTKFAVLLDNHNFYITESGILYQEVPNEWTRWHAYNTSHYCLEYHMTDFKASKPLPRFWVVLEQSDEDSVVDDPVITIGLMISCVFLSLVVLVYAMLPELRNLGGKVQMVYATSLLVAFALLATMQQVLHSVQVCKGLTYGTYFFFLASFCWMNVMSCDIWWTFRGYAKARKIHRRGESFKFFMYCLYAFGLPMSMTVFFVVCNELDLKHLPWFVTPNVPKKACFLGTQEKLLYMYIPMFVLILANWSFYLMTAFNIWRLQRSLSVLNSSAAGTPAAHRQQKYRLLMYLKLSVIMGINWLLEVVSSFYPNFKGWYLTDGYNMLIGLSIFLILICKRRVFRMIRIKYKNLRLIAVIHGWASRRACLRRLLHLNPDAYVVCNTRPGRRRYADSDSETTFSLETTSTAPVCVLPKGPVTAEVNFHTVPLNEP